MARHQINIHFSESDGLKIEALAKAVGKSKSAYVRGIVLDVLREDEIAHGERQAFKAKVR